MTEVLHKYPRTPHLEGSRRQPGDEDLDVVPLSVLDDDQVVVEEKLDGANTALSFSAEGSLRLQSRGHLLVGGEPERQFDLLKAWAHAHREPLWTALGDRYIVYGEWLHAKHTIFYDALPHYFVEFDVLDRRRGEFLSTPARLALLAGLPVPSAPVLWTGRAPARDVLERLISRSRYQSDSWAERLDATLRERGLDVERVRAETDPHGAMEGLYIKVEADGVVVRRAKLVRATFATSVLESASHWSSRPIVPNLLRPGIDLFPTPAR
jgi:hypothetical protein